MHACVLTEENLRLHREEEFEQRTATNLNSRFHSVCVFCQQLILVEAVESKIAHQRRENEYRLPQKDRYLLLDQIIYRRSCNIKGRGSSRFKK